MRGMVPVMKGDEGEAGEREERERETAKYFRAMHFSTESRVDAVDMLTDAENGAPS